MFKIYMLKVVTFIYNQKDPIFKSNISRNKKYLEKHIEPANDFERSYYQYRAQAYSKGFIMSFILNSVSFFLTVPYLMIYIIKSKNKNKVKKGKEKLNNAVFLTSGFNHEILPNELKKTYKHIKNSNYESEGFLEYKDLIFIIKIFLKYPFSFYFLFKNILKIALYREMIELHDPRAIITYSEYSFTSSILTSYCEGEKIKHINIMHGEKLFVIDDSFFRFSEFYVWDKHYVDLFIKQRAYKDQFIISIPNSLQIDFKKYNIHEKDKVDFKYYLGAEKKDELNIISNHLEFLKSKGFNFIIRPHPRYTDMNLISQIFNSNDIENPDEVSIEYSIAQTRYIISVFSSVLNQGLNSGKEIIIDDVTNYIKYKKLKELNYFILNKKYIKMSNFIREIKEN